MKEIWRNIKGCDGDYQISNFGRIISYKQNKKGKIFKQNKNKRGYIYYKFFKNNKRENQSAHTLVWDHFGDRLRDGQLLQVDHIDENKLNNRIDNLQLLTNRVNCSKGRLKYNYSSNYIGVCFDNQHKKWKSQITINGKKKHIGLFKNEYDAHLAYQKQLNEINVK